LHDATSTAAARPSQPRPRSRRAQSWRSERAQGLIEISLVLPVFLVLLLTTIDFGWALRSYVTITNSAREGARLATTGETEADIKAKVVSASSGLLATTDVTV
jgi:Flp pilus assembly protein TadG